MGSFDFFKEEENDYEVKDNLNRWRDLAIEKGSMVKTLEAEIATKEACLISFEEHHNVQVGELQEQVAGMVPLVKALAKVSGTFQPRDCPCCHMFILKPEDHKPDCPVLKAREMVKEWEGNPCL